MSEENHRDSDNDTRGTPINAGDASTSGPQADETHGTEGGQSMAGDGFVVWEGVGRQENGKWASLRPASIDSRASCPVVWNLGTRDQPYFWAFRVR